MTGKTPEMMALEIQLAEVPRLCTFGPDARGKDSPIYTQTTAPCEMANAMM